MLDGVDRVVDLVGPRFSGLTGASEAEVIAAIGRCDTARLAATDGHFAAIARDGRTVRLARTIGLPLRYFVAKMYHGPFLVVSDRMESICAWCDEQRIGWQFDPAYTRMVPAHYVVEIDQVGCPDPTPRYHRFFDPAVGTGSAEPSEAGAAYIAAAARVVRQWVGAVAADEAIGVAFSGGIDSTATLLLARHACESLGRDPNLVRAFTLDLGGGRDAVQAMEVARSLGIGDTVERIDLPADTISLTEAIHVVEDYHPLDVECAAASLALLRGIRQRHPRLRYLLDGDGGDENLKAYPLEDSDLTLSSILRNPLLYQEGWGLDAIKHSLVYSGGLSRGYMRTWAPALVHGFTAFSPFTARSVIAEAVAIPFERALAGDVARLMTLKQDVVAAGVRAVLGIEMPVNPKRRFQDGAADAPRARVTKAWCRREFDRQWRERLRAADEAANRRSGNEVPVPGFQPVRRSLGAGG
jgi:asparagine synthase (glutamine-hydrolysing)